MPERVSRRLFIRRGVAAGVCAGLPARLAAAQTRPPTSQTQPVGPPSACKAYLANLQKQIPELMRAGGVPGAAVAVIGNGEVVWSQGFGLRSNETRAPVEARTVFEVGGLSRLVSAYAVLSLSNAGRLRLDENLCRYLPPDYVRANPFVNYLTARRLFTDPHNLLNSMPGRTPCDKEGAPLPAGYTYVQGFSCLEAAIQNVTGQPFPAFARAAVLEPFGMSDSSFVWESPYAGTASKGHFRSGKVGMTLRDKYRVLPAGEKAKFDKKYADLKIPASAGGLYTTAPDLAGFIAGLIQKHRSGNERGLLPFLKFPSRTAKGAKNPSVDSDSAGGNEDDWNFIWRGQNARPHDLFKMAGNPGVFNCMAAVKRKGGFVLLTNSGAGGRLFEELRKSLEDPKSPLC